MKLPDIQAHSTPEQLLAGLHAYINAANQMLEDRNMVDLAGLDAVVDVLCQRILNVKENDLPIEAQKAYAEQLESLQDDLSKLQEKMVATQRTIKEEIAVTEQRRKAVHAYRKEKK